ncbi:ferrochelatase [Bifidobacterium sp. ESL0728]|uniref:ferrochelatase n=1 Tax=Bifidobacterium sp. ESL0728 TaxID=2983220 RepID=UPI0023F81B82|nr:ferrochelatase [Bifidobacterium sp. ESL0728]WEV58621.1 ferrochelatase [Bifidobacterium sp. ESL0728]
MTSENSNNATSAPKKAVLLMAYGTPYKTEDIMDYYTNIRHGHKPSEKLYNDLARRYKMIGGTSPLAKLTDNQVSGLQAALDRDHPGEYVVRKGFKYIHPFIGDSVDELVDSGVTEIYGIPMAPQYSVYTAEKDHVQAQEALKKHPGVVYHPIRSWWADKNLMKFWSDQLIAMKDLTDRTDTKVILSAHSLPKHVIVDGDPYYDEVVGNSKAVAKQAGLRDDQFVIAWQSAGRTGEEWIGPDFKETAKDLIANQGIKTIISGSLGFIVDNLEILDDVDIELKDEIEALGGQLRRLQMPNDDSLLIAALEDTVLAAK